MEIDLSNINWNSLSIKEFHELEQKMQEAKKSNKIKKDQRTSGYIPVKIRNKFYLIKQVTYQRLKSLKSEKSKEKLIDEIISTYQPMENL